MSGGWQVREAAIQVLPQLPDKRASPHDMANLVFQPKRGGCFLGIYEEYDQENKFRNEKILVWKNGLTFGKKIFLFGWEGVASLQRF